MHACISSVSKYMNKNKPANKVSAPIEYQYFSWLRRKNLGPIWGINIHDLASLVIAYLMVKTKQKYLIWRQYDFNEGHIYIPSKTGEDSITLRI